MSEPKPFASLSSSLLARKGTAKPAMRPQAFHISGDLSRPTFQAEDDLGWNDMGFDMGEPEASPPPPAPVLVLAPRISPHAVSLHGETVPVGVASPAAEQQSKLAQEYAPASQQPVAQPPVEQLPVDQPPVAARPTMRAAAGSKSKAAFTLRLDAERHLRLRLVCAVQHRSAQHIVTQALDEFLARQPGIDDALSHQAR